MSRKLKKQPYEMTAAELASECERVTGLPTPGYDSTQKEQRQWFVAGCFIICHRSFRDRQRANEAALDILQRQNDYAIYAPYVAQVMGDALNP